MGKKIYINGGILIDTRYFRCMPDWSILNYLFKELNIPSSILELELAPNVDKVTDSEND